MIKYFLYACLIFAHGVNVCSDFDSDISTTGFEPNLIKAIRLNSDGYFSELTPDQWRTYNPQINIRETWKYGLLPIEVAVLHGRIQTVSLLVLHGANVECSEVLRFSLAPISDCSINSKTVALLLTHGATTDLINGQTPLAYMQNKLLERRISQTEYFYPGYYSAIEEMEKTITILEEHEAEKRWSSRKAFCIAVVRGCRERARVAAHKSAIPVGANLLGMPAIGKPSASAAELK